MKITLRLIYGICLLLFMSSLTSYGQTILLVDRDGSHENEDNFTDCAPMFMSALNGLGADYEYWEVLSTDIDGPSIYDMEEYNVVIWFCGEAWSGETTLTAVDEENLMEYLDDGGLLFLSAQDYLWDRYPSGVTNDDDFVWDYIGLRDVAQDVYEVYDPPAQVIGSVGSLAEGMEFEIQNIFGSNARDGLYIDTIIEHIGIDLLDIVSPGNGTIGIQFAEEDYRTAFTTGSFAGIVDSVDRVEFMGAIIAWLYDLYADVPDLSKIDVKLAPNPASDKLSITSNAWMEEVVIYNVTGQEVFKQNINSYFVSLNTSELESGLYFVETRSKDFKNKQKIVVL